MTAQQALNLLGVHPFPSAAVMCVSGGLSGRQSPRGAAQSQAKSDFQGFFHLPVRLSWASSLQLRALETSII